MAGNYGVGDSAWTVQQRWPASHSINLLCIAKYIGYNRPHEYYKPLSQRALLGMGDGRVRHRLCRRLRDVLRRASGSDGNDELCAGRSLIGFHLQGMPRRRLPDFALRLSTGRDALANQQALLYL
jgi:hypothetical protein